MGNTIQMHVVKDAYAARISNLQMYDAVRYVTVTSYCTVFILSLFPRNSRAIVVARMLLVRAKASICTNIMKMIM